MARTIGNRKSLDDIEREAWAPKPSMLDTPAVKLSLQDGPARMEGCKRESISLNGEWRMAWGGTQKERIQNDSWEDSIPAQVPCSVHTALLEAGIIPDPTVGLNDKIAREYCYKVWWLKKEFDINPESRAVQLFFEGICHYGKVWLNGVYLGEHKGMFGRPVFDVSQYLKKHNVLIVKIENSPSNPKPMSEYMDNDEGWHDGVVINCVYGWHYACLPSRGIWAPVGLEEKEGDFWSEKPFVSCGDAKKGIVDICLKIHGKCGKTTITGNIMGKNHEGEGGSFSYECDLTEEEQVLHLQIRIPNPRLWWPVNHGEQNLYTLQLSVVSKGRNSQQFETTFGVRTIEMGPLPGGPYEDKHNWTFLVNKKPIFIKGTNWCTLDVLLRFKEDNYRRFLTLAKNQNIQLLRAWGGGMPETDIFYELCDELGIMVMQEWPTCWDSQKEQPFEELEETVLVHMPRLRNHPSLIMWCGGNESARADGEAMDMMARYAFELDGSRGFHRTSPWGGALHNYSTYWDMQDIDVSLNLKSHFMGEFGMASAPNLNSVNRYVPEEERDIWPPERFGSFGHHTPRFNQLEPNDMEHLGKRVPEFCVGDTMEDFIWGTQMAQATAVRHTLESYRCSWPYSTGICYYKLTDVYPACSWSTIDYYGVPKLSYYAVQDSYEPLHACILLKSMRAEEDLKLPVYLLDDAGALNGLAWRVEAKAYDENLQVISQEVFEGQTRADVTFLGHLAVKKALAGDGPVLLTTEVWAGDEKKDQTFYWINYQKKQGCLKNLPKTSLSLRTEDKVAVIKNTGNVPAAGVILECLPKDTTFVAEDGLFWLNPGEIRRIAVTDTQNLTVSAWNLSHVADEKIER